MRVISRQADAGIEIFDENLEPLRILPAPPEVEGWAVSSTRDGLVYATGGAVVRIGPHGDELWRFDLGPNAGNARTDVTFSADDALVWVYAPNVYAGRAAQDEWIVLDAATGAVRSRRALPSSGHGGAQFPLRDGRMLLDVGEGRDGSQIYLAAAASEIHDFGWGDRVLIDVSPGQTRFLTVHHEQEDVAVHDFPGGGVRFRLTPADFGFDEDSGVVVEWSGGFLDDRTVVVVLTAEDEETEQEWWRHFRVDAGTGEVLGDLGIVTIHGYDLRPLGDGTYVITDTDGTLRRM
ncbi:hypothetical protein [Actinoplanes siamensis]|uniref:Uncharacterized protein n=1 Tax=Actinoplanes siamensis TaxID=1223317 RepID=A0A919TPG0_9ACTN|nr:hypothetical protein [Actinoplanes siamensis]GIF09742.1 hypothetical protein Asi03nite_72800 [Actinoplanes siamensis]